MCPLASLSHCISVYSFRFSDKCQSFSVASFKRFSSDSVFTLCCDFQFSVLALVVGVQFYVSVFVQLSLQMQVLFSVFGLSPYFTCPVSAL